ncbi:hypothetical protein BBJ28_00018483 [Nothophytophthora sp. Chile5]|nr:hypothetical protein BBJ28_00018483 [Nothophytophthora sp. Chile5]
METSAAPRTSLYEQGSTSVLIKRKPGRRTDPVWDDVIVDDGIVSCKRCEKIIHHMGKTHVERVRYHMEKKCIKRAKTTLITTSFNPVLSAEAIEAFQQRFALWFYSTGMAFNKISHPSLTAALSLLHPGAVVPSRQQLATSLLDSCYENFKLKIAHEFAETSCTLTTDAWTDVNGKAVINYVAICGKQTFYLESVYTGAVSHGADYLASDIERVIHDYSWLKVAAVVTDNTATNKLVQQLWFEIRRLQAAEGKRALVLPADTRWGTIEQCFSTLLSSEQILFTFVSSRNFLKAKTKEQKAKRRFAYDTVTASDFVEQLRKAVKILEVLSNFQKTFERNITPISDVYQMFLRLPAIYGELEMPITEYGLIVRVIQDRFNFVYGDAHGVAFLLDPRYAGVDMDLDTCQRVKDFIYSWHGAEKEEATSVELVKYHASLTHRSRELKLVEAKKISVREFWLGLRQYPLLQDIALAVFSSACSSAAAERNFSAHKFVHSQVRNRLGEDTVKKLVFLFFNLKNVDEEDLALYDMLEDLSNESDTDKNTNEDSDYEYY